MPRGRADIRDGGDRALFVILGDEPAGDVPRRVRDVHERLRAAAIPGVRALVPAYTSVMVEIDPSHPEWGRIEDRLREVLLHISAPVPHETDPPREVEIPVCYLGDDFAPDLPEIASRLEMDPEEVVRRHTAPLYRVHFLGFMPGFPYLGGLDPTLAVPRLATPRTRVPAGSVGIAGSQTGVYPFATPGGWRIVGQTPVPLYDPSRTPRAWLRMGDRVRFVPVSRDRFEEIREGIR